MRRGVVCRAMEIVQHQGGDWSVLARRAGLPAHVVRRLRRPHTNPSLAVAERVANALDVPIEALWRLRR